MNTPTPDTHRNWLIEQNWLGQWEATHPDFDGLEDNLSWHRCRHGKTMGRPHTLHRPQHREE